MVVGVVGVGLTAGDGIAQEPARAAKEYTLEDYTVGDSPLARLQKEYRGAVGIKIKGMPIAFKIDSDGEMSWEFGFSVPLKDFEFSFDAGVKKPEPPTMQLGPESFRHLVRRETPFAAMQLIALQDQIKQKDQEILALKAELAELKRRQLLLTPTPSTLFGAPRPWMPPTQWMPPAQASPGLFESSSGGEPASPGMFDRLSSGKAGSMAAETAKSSRPQDKP